jgi:uncharacterized protein YdaT
MSFSTIQYPTSFGMLKPEIRRLAIEIANRLIEEGLSRFVAEQIAIANSSEIAKSATIRTNLDIVENTIHVVPHLDGWAIISQDARKVYDTYIDKKTAIVNARKYAKSVKFKLFIHSEDGTISDSENFIVNRPNTLAPDRLPLSRENFKGRIS